MTQGDGLSRVGVGSYHPPRQYENTERIGEGSRRAMAGEYERNMHNNPTAVAFAVSSRGGRRKRVDLT